MADKTRTHDLKPPEQQSQISAQHAQSFVPESAAQRGQRLLGNRFLARRAGRPLPPRTQATLGQALDADLSGVRIHTDSQAAAAARLLNATAFTSGQDIYFAPNQYQPDTPSGRRLLAHETVHTIQQARGGTAPGRHAITQPGDSIEAETDRAAQTVMAGGTVSPGGLSASAPGLIARQAAPAAASVGQPGTGGSGGPGTPAVDPAAPPDEISLAAPTFQPTPAVTAYLDSQKNDTGDVRVRLGGIAAGAIRVRKRSTKSREGETLFETPGERPQAVPLTIAALQPLANAGVQPVLAVKIDNNRITGYVTIATSKGMAGRSDDLVEWIEKHSAEFGWAGIDVSKFPKPKNELADGVLRLQVDNFRFKLGGYVEGTGSFGLANEVMTFNATAAINVKGITEGAQIEISRDEKGGLYAKTEIPVTLAKFSGNLIAELGNGTFNVQGTVRYQAEKFSGEVTLLITDAATARQVALQRLGPDAIANSAQQAQGGQGEQGAGRGPKPGERAVAGWGVLNFAITDWMTGTAQVIIDNEGHITVVGEIRPPAEVILFEQRDYIKELLGLEVRASYGIPVVGNIFVFAGIKVAALAKLGPGKIYNIVLKGTYSTDPAVLQNFSISGSLNISAFAGLRVRAEGGAGLEILDHDIKAGVGLNALAGVRGYVEATPTIGYRETAAPEEGKKGEYYIKGHMEIAAQPFLGLSGDLFIELDSPWWSPAPDKTWTWPIGELEYPLPGQFGIGADVDYVLGSDNLPDIQFGEVNFDKEKFMTDLMNDHVPKGGGKADQEKQGEWKEGQPAGEGAVDPQLAPGGAPPAAAQPATGQQTPADGQPVPPEKMQNWAAGIKALGTLATTSQRDPLSRDELDARLEAIKKTYGFSSLRVEQSGEDWLVYPSMSPEPPKGVKIEGEGKAPAAQREPWMPSHAADEQIPRLKALRDTFIAKRATPAQLGWFTKQLKATKDAVELQAKIEAFERGLEERALTAAEAEAAENAPVSDLAQAAAVPGGENLARAEAATGEGVQTTGRPPGGKQPRRFEIGNLVHQYAEELSRRGLLSPPLPAGVELEPEHPFILKYRAGTVRADRIDTTNRVIYEIKPRGQEAQGRAQLQTYAQHAAAELGGVWRTQLVVYNPPAAAAYLESIGAIEK